MRILFISIILLIACTGCPNHSTEDINIMSEQLKLELQSLQTMRIFFGHRSVGNNILKGLEEVLLHFPDIHLHIINLDYASELPEYYLAHYGLGENGNPISKCDAFLAQIPKMIENHARIGMFKFCFVDFDEKTDVEKVFKYYQQVIQAAREKYPEMTIVHVTVPLLAGSKGLKKKFKRFLGIADWSDASNIKRNQFNRLLLHTYQGEPIYNLAALESTYLDGRRAGFRKNGELYYELIGEYTDDGGHLNTFGRKIAAVGLIKILADVNDSLKISK